MEFCPRRLSAWSMDSVVDLSKYSATALDPSFRFACVSLFAFIEASRGERSDDYVQLPSGEEKLCSWEKYRGLVALLFYLRNLYVTFV